MGCLPGSAQRSSPHEQSPDRVRCTPGTTGQRHSSTTRRSVRAMRAAMAEDPSTDPPLGPTGLHTEPEGRASRDPPSCPASLGSSTSCAVSAFRGSTTSYPPSLYRRHHVPHSAASCERHAGEHRIGVWRRESQQRLHSNTTRDGWLLHTACCHRDLRLPCLSREKTTIVASLARTRPVGAGRTHQSERHSRCEPWRERPVLGLRREVVVVP